MLHGQFLAAQEHVGHDLLAQPQRFVALVEFLAHQEAHGVVHADEPDDVGGLLQFDVGLAVARRLADLPQGEAGAADHFGDARALLLVGLHAQVHHLVDFGDEPVERAHARAGGAVHALRDVDGDVLEAAETQAFGVPQHVVVLDRRAQAAAGGQRDFVAVEDEIDRAVAAGHFAGAAVDLHLLGIGERLGADVEIALREFEDVPVGVAGLPDVEQGAGQFAGLFLEVAVGQDAFAAGGEILFDFGVVGLPVLGIGHFAQDAAAGAVGLGREQFHHAVAVGVLFGADGFLEAHHFAVGAAQHVAAVLSDGGDGLEVARHAGVDVEVEEDRLAAARERVLGAAEDEALGDLANFLGALAAQIGRKHDVDVGQAEGAGVVGLHRGHERVQVAGQHVGARGGRAVVVEVVQPAQAVLLDVFDRVRRTVDAVRIAQVVQVQRAGVVRVLEVGGEDRVQRPLLEHQLRDAQLDGLGVVVDDVAVLEALRVHQPVHELPRHAVDRQVAQLVAVAAQRQLVVEQLADQRAVHAAHAAGDDLVFHRLGDVERDLFVQVGVAHERVDEFLAVPRQRAAARDGFHQQHAGVGEVHGLVAVVLVLVAHADALAGQLAVLAEALVGGDDRRVALLGQHDLDQVLHVLDVRNAAAVFVGRDMVLAVRIGKLLDDEFGHLLGHRLPGFDVIAPVHFVGGPADRQHDFVAPERHHHPIPLAEPVEDRRLALVHACLPPDCLLQKIATVPGNPQLPRTV